MLKAELILSKLCKLNKYSYFQRPQEQFGNKPSPGCGAIFLKLAQRDSRSTIASNTLMNNKPGFVLISVKYSNNTFLSIEHCPRCSCSVGTGAIELDGSIILAFAIPTCGCSRLLRRRSHRRLQVGWPGR